MKLTSQPGASTQPADNQATSASQSVTVAPATFTSITQTVEVTGTVAALDLLPISAKVSGLQIQQVLIDEGQTVEAGQVLAVLDRSVLQAQLTQAEADVASTRAVVQQRQAGLAQQQATLTQAAANLRRYQELAQQGAISAKDLDAYVTTFRTAQEAANVAEANITSAEADVQSKLALVQKLQTQIEQTLVRAPSRGMIAEKIARVGGVTGNDKLFSLIRAGALELQAKVPQTELSRVKIGSPAQISSDADQRLRLQGRVREIAPLVDAQSRQATVKIDLPQSELLRPGMFLRAAIAVQTAQAITVPASAVLPQADGQSLVYVLKDNLVHAQPVEVGTRRTAADPTQAKVEIRRGLNAGDRVVVDGAGYVKDGDHVIVVQ
jgi:RND family efflux transporter MFP subunit